MLNSFSTIKSQYVRIILIPILLALSSVSSYAATGSITISTPTIKPIIVGTTPNTSTLIVNGSYSLLADSTPSGPSNSYICSDGANGTFVPYIPSQMGNMSFKNYAKFNIDIGPLKYIGRGDIRTIGQVTPFGVRFDTLRFKMKPGSYTMKFYMTDSWMVTCPSYPWVLKTDNITTVFVSKTIDFIIKDLTVSVQVTLANTQVSGCETIAGSLTVNDPAGQGGTVALSLPDGTSSNFTYAGSAPTPIPFSYAVSEPVGSTLTFSATATSNSGATSNQPATATANVIAGGLTITMMPDTAIVEPQLRDRKIKFIQNGKMVVNKHIQQLSARTQDIQISVSGPQGPVAGAQVIATLEMFPGAETFGGHDHGATGRPLSTLGSLSAVKEVNGVYHTTYSSSIYASKAQIRVTATNPNSQCTGEFVSKPFIAQVSGLVQWNTALGINRPVGGTCNHYGPADSGTTCTSPNNNHYLTQASINKLIRLQQAYIKEYPNLGGLRINDASLPNGGAFEATTRALWVSEAKLVQKGFGHITHRRGLDIDIGNRDTYDIPGKPPYTVTARALRKLNEQHDNNLFATLKDESSSSNHLHIYFE